MADRGYTGSNLMTETYQLKGVVSLLLRAFKPNPFRWLWSFRGNIKDSLPKVKGFDEDGQFMRSKEKAEH
jgi:hypothetical protein